MFGRKATYIRVLENSLFYAENSRQELIKEMNTEFSKTLISLLAENRRLRVAWKSAKRRATSFRSAYKVTSYVLNKLRDNDPSP